MNLEELQSVQSRERQASQLQHLRASFYEDVGEYIGGLRAERNEVAAASDNPFDDPEVERLSDEIQTAEGTVESIYERRVGKVVKLASIAAAGMSHQEDGLTTEEEQLFERLVDAIEHNRECVLSVLDGETPSLNCTPADGDGSPGGAGTDPESGSDRTARADPGDASHAGDENGDDGWDAPEAPGSPGTAEAPGSRPGTDAGADVGGRGPSGTADGEDRPTPPDRPPAAEPGPGGTDADDDVDGGPLDVAGAMGAPDGTDGPEAGRDAAPVGVGGDTGRRDDPGTGRPGGSPAGEDRPDGPPGEGHDPPGESGDAEAGPVERTTIRITADVGEVFGVDGRAYDLSAEDVVTLPTPNAEGLVSKEAAERLD